MMPFRYRDAVSGCTAPSPSRSRPTTPDQTKITDTTLEVSTQRGEPRFGGLGVYRWVLEQGFALVHWFRRLRIRWEIRDDIHEAFLHLACGIIRWHRLINLSLCAEF